MKKKKWSFENQLRMKKKKFLVSIGINKSKKDKNKK